MKIQISSFSRKDGIWQPGSLHFLGWIEAHSGCPLQILSCSQHKLPHCQSHSFIIYLNPVRHLPLNHLFGAWFLILAIADILVLIILCCEGYPAVEGGLAVSLGSTYKMPMVCLLQCDNQTQNPGAQCPLWRKMAPWEPLGLHNEPVPLAAPSPKPLCYQFLDMRIWLVLLVGSPPGVRWQDGIDYHDCHLLQKGSRSGKPIGPILRRRMQKMLWPGTRKSKCNSQ